jgi:hypothetical protein
MVFWVSLASFRVPLALQGADHSHGCEQGYEASSEVYRMFKGE